MWRTVRRSIRRRPALRAWLLPWWVFTLGLAWKIRKQFRPCAPVVVGTPTGPVYMLAEGQIAEYMWSGGFEREERDFINRVVRPGMRIVNVGANAGLYCLITSRLVGKLGQVHAFEPSTSNFKRLCRNLSLNRCTNVRSSRLAIGEARERVAVVPDPENPALDGHLRCRRFDGPPPPETMELSECETLDHYWTTLPEN